MLNASGTATFPFPSVNDAVGDGTDMMNVDLTSVPDYNAAINDAMGDDDDSDIDSDMVDVDVYLNFDGLEN